MSRGTRHLSIDELDEPSTFETDASAEVDALNALDAGMLDAQARTVVIDASRKGGGYTSPTHAPLVSAVVGTPSISAFRVWRDDDGTRVFLGSIGSSATPEMLIARYPGAMPRPGETARFILKGIGPDQREVSAEIPFSISGDAPAVLSARQHLAGAAVVAPTPNNSAFMEAALIEAREENRRVAEALGLERRQLADRALSIEHERALAVKADSEQRIQIIIAEAKAEQERERERRRQDREDIELRYKADAARADEQRRAERDDRDRRETREREAAAERERDRAASLAAEREREREYHSRIAALNAASSLESTVGKAGALMAAIGVSPADLIGKLLGGGGDGAAPVVTEGTAAVIGNVVGKLVEQIGAVVQTQMQLQAGQQAHGVTVTQQPRPMPAPPRQITAAPAVPAAPAPEAPKPTVDPALAALTMPTLRRARNALRSLAGVLQGEEESHWQATIIGAVTATPEIVPYVKAVGVRRAVIEAGMSEEQATKIEAAIPPGVLG